MCIGKPPIDLPIGFINNEPSLEESDNLVQLGEEFFAALNNQTLIKKRFANFSQGYEELEQGRVWSLIEIDRNFSTDLLNAYFEKELPNNFPNSMHIYMDNTSE
jgi:uncharacterized phage infection (PIP) family protein YhgE